MDETAFCSLQFRSAADVGATGRMGGSKRGATTVFSGTVNSRSPARHIAGPHRKPARQERLAECSHLQSGSSMQTLSRSTRSNPPHQCRERPKEYNLGRIKWARKECCEVSQLWTVRHHTQTLCADDNLAVPNVALRSHKPFHNAVREGSVLPHWQARRVRVRYSAQKC